MTFSVLGGVSGVGSVEFPEASSWDKGEDGLSFTSLPEVPSDGVSDGSRSVDDTLGSSEDVGGSPESASLSEVRSPSVSEGGCSVEVTLVSSEGEGESPESASLSEVRSPSVSEGGSSVKLESTALVNVCDSSSESCS